MTASHTAPNTALVVHDDPQLAAVIEFALETCGCTVHLARSTADAEQLAALPRVRLVVLDLTLTSIDGTALCALVRRVGDAAILALVADPLATDGPRVDDHLTKPFHPRELATRACALLTRAASARGGTELHVGRLRIQQTLHRVSFAGRRIELPFTELRLLAHLATHRGTPQSWRSLLQAVWGTDQFVGGRDVVKSAVYRLRGRLVQAGGDPGYVRTLRGAGYVMPDLPPVDEGDGGVGTSPPSRC